MPKNPYENTVEVARRTMTLFFVVDTSGSMEGDKIGAVNSAIEEVIPEIRDNAETNPDAELKIAVLQFSEGAKWITAEPMKVDKYEWKYLQADGTTDLGSALKELNAKLSRNAFMNDAAGSFAPAIFLFSDGEPTDNWKSPFKEIKENKWFQSAMKIAVAIGDDANKEVLAEFTGNKELVVTARNPEALRKFIRFASVTASQIGSKGSSVGVGSTKVDEVKPKIDEFVEVMKNNADIQELISQDPSKFESVDATGGWGGKGW